MPALNLGANQSRNTIPNKNTESLICVKVFWTNYWATQNSYDLTVSLRKSFSLERGKLRTTSAATTSFHADPLLSYHSNCSFYIVRPYFDLIWNNFITGKQEWDDLNMNIIFHVKIPFVKYSQWRCLKKRSNLIFDHIFVGHEKERLGEKDSGKRDR